ncbi:hypothetical protein [Marinospirillum alkaliphilum]|uniref:Uncharacterized protein n=1 Tax=Marinospirillum alkaliphilum DSM 21637 TaxID=1122209 RepID=A0A1K1YPG0_9GAMM|nr:hypothetical protein [Marinospirillum alkaliphilum]SFX63236.1 hypothetical protein SAMN02745752_02327 [Marinospirillum alkaliphilum DSM 21637]
MRSRTTEHKTGVTSLLLAFLLAAVVFAVLGQALRHLAETTDDDGVFALIIKGEALLLDASVLDALNRDLRRFSQQEQQQLATWMDSWSEQQLDQLFALSHAGVDAYLDWYYSMPGSYLRLYHAMKGDLSEQLENQLQQRAFEQSGFVEALDQLSVAYTEAFQQQLLILQQQQLASWQQQLHQQYAARQVTGGSAENTTASALEPAFTIHLDQALQLDLAATEADFRRWQQSGSLSVAAGASVLALPAARVMAGRLMQRTGVRSAVNVTLRYLARLTPRVAAAMTASGAATAAAAPSGPGALVAGATTLTLFVVSDWALLKAEEAIYRPDKAAELHAGLALWRETLAEELNQAAAPLFAARQDFLKSRLNRPYQEAGVERRFYLFPEWNEPVQADGLEEAVAEPR